jgi:hypothetical protein
VAGSDWQSLIKRIVRITHNDLHRDARTGLRSSTSEVAFYLAKPRYIGAPCRHRVRHHWHVFRRNQTSTCSQDRSAAQLRALNTLAGESLADDTGGSS